MAEQMIRKPDNKMDKNTVEDSEDKQTGSEKAKKSEKGKGKIANRRSQSKTVESNVSPLASLEQQSDKTLPLDKTGPSAASGSENQQILTMLKNIQENQNKQSQEIKSLSSRMTDYENNYDHDEEEYEDTQADIQAFDDDIQAVDNVETLNESSVSKRKPDDNNNTSSRFASMSKRFKTREICGEKIDETLAQNVTDLFRNGMNEDQFAELTKDENNPRPENCEGLALVKTNQLVWDIISPQAQTVERKMQLIQKAVVKAATILVSTVNKMATSDEAFNESNIDNCNDVLALLGHANRKINITRRELMKPEMSSEYVHLCSQSVDYTSYLFGDDVSKKAKEIEDCSKIGFKIGFGGGNRYYSRRGNARFFGRGRGGRRGRGTGRGGRRGSRYSGYSQAPSETPKNSQRRGGFQNKDKN